MKKLLFILSALLLLFSACKTDFEINAKWKDIPVVFGLLNQKDTTHYIIISKAFLGDNNALLTAQNPDSCYYNVNNLNVRIEEWKNNSQTNNWILDTTTIYNKEQGTFSYPKQVIYKFEEPNLDINAEYRLFITNKITGKIISSKTNLIHNFSIIKPVSSASLNFTSINPIPIRWNTASNGKLYQVVMRFSYKETNTITNQSTIKSIDWSLGSYKSQSIDGNESLETNYNGTSFYSFLHDNIDVSPNLIRSIAGMYPVELIFSVATDDFNKYMEVNSPSTGVLQYKPEFTNINNGIGLFSSRFQVINKHYMNSISIDSLFNGSFTKDLNFQ